MEIKPVTTEAVEAALKIFDSTLRDSKDYAGWENKRNYLYAISHGGRLYPPKKIISLATGMPVNSFYGGEPSNNYLRARGFEIVPVVPLMAKPLPKFVVGNLYKRATEIHGLYGGNAQSGISVSAMTDAIFLFTGDSGQQYGYNDGPTLDSDGNAIYLYTGEGQSGNMQFTRGNLSILEHTTNGRALHLFYALGKGKPCKYLGEYLYAGHEIKLGKDRSSEQRDVIEFHLLSVADVERSENLEDLTFFGTGGKAADEWNSGHGAGPEDRSKNPWGEKDHKVELDLLELRKRAIAAAQGKQNGDRHGVRNLYNRSRAVRDYVLRRAEGACELCKTPAPFIRLNGSPYLEPHHTTKVSDGGPDHPAYVGAICPTCHREIHYGVNGVNKNAELQNYLLEIESQGLYELIEKVKHVVNEYQLTQLDLDSNLLSAIEISIDVENGSAGAPHYLQMITIDPLIKKGESKKLSNLTINIKKVFRDLSAATIGGQIATALAPAPAIPLLLAALGLCVSLSAHRDVPVDYDHILVVYALWRNVDRANKISMTDAFEVSRQAFSIRQLAPLTQQSFGFIIENLKNLKIIKLQNNKIELIEKVMFSEK